MIHNLSEILQNKTRLVLYTNGKSFAMDILLHTVKSAGKSVDIFSKGVVQTSESNDFIVMEITCNDNLSKDIQWNIAFLSSTATVDNERIVSAMAAGGVLIYPTEYNGLDEALKHSANFFRKMDFCPPSYELAGDTVHLNTDLGEIPINLPAECLHDIEGIRLTAQQLGVMEDEFYESLISYQPIS